MKDEVHDNNNNNNNNGSFTATAAQENPPSSKSSNNSCNTATTNTHTQPPPTINKEQDKFLPIANVGRIMKKAIPANGKISKEAKETVQECVSEFISFVTGEASEKCQKEKRKTINGEDIIFSLTSLGFEDYVEPLKRYLNKYREMEDEKQPGGPASTATSSTALPKPQQRLSSSSSSSDHSQQQQFHMLQQQHHLHDHHHHQLHHHLHNNQHGQFIDQTTAAMIGVAGVSGLAPPPPYHPGQMAASSTPVYSNPIAIHHHHHHHNQPPPPPPPPAFVGAEQAGLMSLPNFLPTNSLQKTYQHPEQIDSVGHW